MRYNPNRERLTKCAECGSGFWHKRATARFCCAACRARNYRRNNPLWRSGKSSKSSNPG